MRNTTALDTARDARQRVDRGLEALRIGLGAYVERHMRDRRGDRWRDHVSRARGDEAGRELDVYALLKTLLDNWNDLFRHDPELRRARSFISLAMDARNRTAHFAGELSTREALRYLDAMRELAAAAGGAAQAAIIEKLYEEQVAADSSRVVPAPARPVPDRTTPSAPVRGKYAPLFRHFVAMEVTRWHATFDQIENILGFDLPASARRHPAWWANQETGRSHALAWQAAGWRTRNLSLAAETVTFERATNLGARARDGR